MPRVIHFEIVADNPERAMKFYNEVFVEVRYIVLADVWNRSLSIVNS
jgi:hypothetical protein